MNVCKTNFLLDLMEQMELKKANFAAATEPGVDIQGPLSSVIENNEDTYSGDTDAAGGHSKDFMSKFGNSLIFAFAGHGT